jgi:hypothetical protein
MIAAVKLQQHELAVVAELLPEPDFGGVVAADRHRLDRTEELNAHRIAGCVVLIVCEAREQRRLLLLSVLSITRKSELGAVRAVSRS